MQQLEESIFAVAPVSFTESGWELFDSLLDEYRTLMLNQKEQVPLRLLELQSEMRTIESRKLHCNTVPDDLFYRSVAVLSMVGALDIVEQDQ